MKCFSNQLRNSTAGYILRKKRRGPARKEGNEMVLLFKQQQRAFCCHKLKEVKNERERDSGRRRWDQKCQQRFNQWTEKERDERVEHYDVVAALRCAFQLD